MSENWIQEFSDWLQAQDRSPRTVDSYTGALRVFGEWFAVSYNRPFAPRELTTRDVIAYRDEQLNIKGLSASTINVSLAAINKLVKWAIETGQLARNPVTVRHMDLEAPGPRWMQRGELRKLLAEFERAINDARARGAIQRSRQAVRNMAAVALMAGAGLRINEVAQLDLSDLKMLERKGSVLVRHGKGRKQRELPLSTETRRLLQEWLAERGPEPGPLFPSQKGGRIVTRELQRIFAEKARRAGVEGYTPHSLRHTFLKQVFDRTSNISVVQRLAGHARVEDTVRYVLPSLEEIEAAMEGAML